MSFHKLVTPLVSVNKHVRMSNLGVKDEISKTKFMGENGELLMGFSIFSIEIVSILCHFMPLAPPPRFF